MVMDTYRHDSAHVTCGPSTASLEASAEEQATHRRWGAAVLAFYGALFALVGIAILVGHSIADQNNQIAQASLQNSSVTQAAR
jgi:hypothetical protein